MILANPVFLLFAALVLLALAPLLLSLWRAGTPRGRRDSALALHRAQLEELDREREDGRIGAAEHAGARLEVQRRLLAVADLPDDAGTATARLPLLAALVLLPLAATGLYLIGGHPELPSGARFARTDLGQEAEADRLIATLRSRLAQMDPKSDLAVQGYVLLGNAEASRAHLSEAAAAWRTALEAGFNPSLAAEAAEAQFEADGKMTQATEALFRHALAEAPPDASWRGLAQQRLSDVKR